MKKIKINKKVIVAIILSLILITQGVGCIYHFNNYNTVKVGGRVKALKMENFWSGNRYYLLLERDNDRGERAYEISEKDYYKLGKGYVIIFMDGHIETLKEFERKKDFRRNIDPDEIHNNIIKTYKQFDNKVPDYIKSILYFSWIIAVILIIIYFSWKKKK